MVIVVLVVVNGIFAMSEMALVSAGRARLQKAAQEGDRRARAALDLVGHPDDFLATVQIGITLVGVLAGAFGGARVAGPLAALLERVDILAPHSEGLALGIVVLAITYLSLVFGELVPKRLALLRPDAIARRVARPVRWLSRGAAPFVRVLSGSTRVVLRLLGARPVTDGADAEEEIKLLAWQGAQAGVFEEAEQQMVERVFRFGDRTVAAVMTPRRKIVWLDVDDGPEAVRATLSESPFSRYPVVRGHLDNCVGFVEVKDLLDSCLEGRPIELGSLVRQPLLVPEGTRALMVLERFKSHGTYVAFVVDEHGGIDGLVTLTDLLEEIVGDVPGPGEETVPPATRRQDGSWLVDGTMLVEDLAELLRQPSLAGGERRGYKTLAGLVMARLQRVPREGDTFDWARCHFEVVDMDGHQVDKVLLTPLAEDREPVNE